MWLRDGRSVVMPARERNVSELLSGCSETAGRNHRRKIAALIQLARFVCVHHREQRCGDEYSPEGPRNPEHNGREY
jgi:hypothetical protein